MTIRRVAITWSACSMMLLGMVHTVTATEKDVAVMAQADIDQASPESTGFFAPPMLHVKPRPVAKLRFIDKPWDPRVCTGCELNNRPSQDR